MRTNTSEPTTSQIATPSNTTNEQALDSVLGALELDRGNSSTLETAGVKIASLSPTTTGTVDSTSDTEALSIGIREYSQRLMEFHGQLVARVYRKIQYPNRAVRRNLEGRLELDVTLNENGNLIAVEIAQSSGHKILDSAAIKAAQKALSDGVINGLDAVAIAEFGTQNNQVTVPVPVQFQLTKK